MGAEGAVLLIGRRFVGRKAADWAEKVRSPLIAVVTLPSDRFRPRGGFGRQRLR